MTDYHQTLKTFIRVVDGVNQFGGKAMCHNKPEGYQISVDFRKCKNNGKLFEHILFGDIDLKKPIDCYERKENPRHFGLEFYDESGDWYEVIFSDSDLEQFIRWFDLNDIICDKCGTMINQRFAYCDCSED